MSEDEGLSRAAHERLGQVIASISFLREDIHRMISRLAEGQSRMDFLSEENHNRKSETQMLRLEFQQAIQLISTSAPVRSARPEPASSWGRLASACSDVATEWGITKRDVIRWIALAFLAVTLNHGEFAALVKVYLTHAWSGDVGE